MENETTHKSEISYPSWIDKVIIRHLIFSDLPHLEWDGEYKHLRNVYHKAYQYKNQGKNVLWVADLPHIGIIGQVFIQLNSMRKDLADGFFSAYLYAFRIKPEYRNAGLGTRMFSIVEEDLIKRKFREITLNVAKTNPDAVRLYNRMGFEIIGSESGEWSYRDDKDKLRHVSEPAWKMVKRLQ
jgi:ribosomal protein S18 acetylase RimI-like enzyme